MHLHHLFSDHMVLQQGIACPVWGWDAPGQSVTVAMAGRTATAAAGADGRWQVELGPFEAGGPHTLTAEGSRTVTLHDVLVGEVWVGSGQSNMQWAVGQANNADAEITAADHPRLRLFQVPPKAALEPQTDVPGAWRVCTPETVTDFSAVAYFFGRDLVEHVGVPVGLIHSSWGGTIAEAWTSRQGLIHKAGLAEEVAAYEEELEGGNREERLAAYRQEAARIEREQLPADPGDTGHAQGWAAPGADLADWSTMDLPRLWQREGLDFNGSLWFRRDVELPPAWAGRDLVLSLGALDKSDTTWCNNERVGGLSIEERPDAWCTPRVYPVPGRLVQAGTNTIAVRVFSGVHGGGFGGLSTDMWIGPEEVPPEERIPLAGAWRYRVEHNLGRTQPPALPPMPRGEGNQNSPYILYDSMIAPLIPFGIRGVIWYQGESNAQRAEAYRRLFGALIEDWREAWGLGTFPFYFVQLASYDAQSERDGRCLWAELREAQRQTLEVPQTGMAVTIDIGEAKDIHPPNKQDVGARLARIARAEIYGQDIESSGPLYAGMDADGDAMRIRFAHAKGLKTADSGPVRGFTVAGADGRFVPAQAVIDGGAVRVKSPDVSAPKAVRYAWADVPDANLVNHAGLPASPFRTDV